MLDFEYSQLMPLIYRYHVASSLPYGGGKRQVFFYQGFIHLSRSHVFNHLLLIPQTI